MVGRGHNNLTFAERLQLSKRRQEIRLGIANLECESFLPSQLDDSPPDSCYRRLARGIMVSTYRILQKHEPRPHVGSRWQEFWECVHWLFTEPDNFRYGSLSWCCAVLGLDPAYVREHSVSLKPKRRRPYRSCANVYVLRP